MQGVNQKALLVYVYIYVHIQTTEVIKQLLEFQMYAFSCRYSNVDMSSQEAYELAVKGALRPDGKTPPIMLGLRCLHFQPPHFTLGEW